MADSHNDGADDTDATDDADTDELDSAASEEADTYAEAIVEEHARDPGPWSADAGDEADGPEPGETEAVPTDPPVPVR